MCVGDATQRVCVCVCVDVPVGEAQYAGVVPAHEPLGLAVRERVRGARGRVGGGQEAARAHQRALALRMRRQRAARRAQHAARGAARGAAARAARAAARRLHVAAQLRAALRSWTSEFNNVNTKLHNLWDHI